MILGKRTREVLQKMADHADEEDGTLTQSTPGGWWLGYERVGGVVGYTLLRFCLIRDDSFSRESYHMYTITEEGRQALTNPDYQPIIPLLR